MNYNNLWLKETIIDCYKDQDYFNHDYTPNKINYRDNESKTIATYMKTIIYNKKPTHTLILGNSGTGKTTVIRKLCKSFNSKLSKPSNSKPCKAVHINCQFHTTIREIYCKLHKTITGEQIINKSTSTIEVFNKLIKHLKKNKTDLIICLDDIDNYLRKKEINKLFYQLLRSHEEEQNNIKIGLIVIISNNNFPLKLNQKNKSFFNYKEVHFKDYTKEQLFHILKERCMNGFCQHVITDEQIRTIANYCSVYSDLRGGLSLLSDLGNMINIEGDCKIRDHHIDIAIRDFHI